MATPTPLKSKFNSKTSYAMPRDWNQNSHVLGDSSKGRPFGWTAGPWPGRAVGALQAGQWFCQAQGPSASPLWYLHEPKGQRPEYQETKCNYQKLSEGRACIPALCASPVVVRVPSWTQTVYICLQELCPV